MRDAIASAPGRVNLMGEHTDYNGGLVLPLPIPQRTTASLRARVDDQVTVTSREMPGERASYRLGDERRRGNWVDYVMGCTAALREAGHRLGGFELELASDVPLGAGVSSSAALEIALLRALRAAAELAIDDVALALLGQRAENELVGAPVGAMDQLAASLGEAGAALLLDMQTLASRPIALPASLDVVVIGSGVTHALSDGGGYRQRRAECEEAARALGVTRLRELGTPDLARIAALAAPLDRRVRHVVNENARVLETVLALQADDRGRLRELFADSHASMRDDFEISVPEIDLLVKLAMDDADVVAARLTGGGFGGSMVTLANAGRGAAAAARIAEPYRAATGHDARALLVGAAERTS